MMDNPTSKTLIPKYMKTLRKTIINWYQENGRIYPWRQTQNPFQILIAQMMLRRTKADQVLPVYIQFLKTYPDIDSLSKAKQESLEKILYPLGLKWRISAFKEAAQKIKEKYNSRIPEIREELKSLPGVGEYVAGAVLAIAFNKEEWLVDSNIVRVFKRYFGIETSKEGRRDKHIIEISKIFAMGKDPSKATLGILDISSLLCKPIKPICERCPLKKRCHYRLSKLSNK